MARVDSPLSPLPSACRHRAGKATARTPPNRHWGRRGRARMGAHAHYNLSVFQWSIWRMRVGGSKGPNQVARMSEAIGLAGVESGVTLPVRGQHQPVARGHSSRLSQSLLFPKLLPCERSKVSGGGRGRSIGLTAVCASLSTAVGWFQSTSPVPTARPARLDCRFRCRDASPLDHGRWRCWRSSGVYWPSE